MKGIQDYLLKDVHSFKHIVQVISLVLNGHQVV